MCQRSTLGWHCESRGTAGKCGEGNCLLAECCHLTTKCSAPMSRIIQDGKCFQSLLLSWSKPQKKRGTATSKGRKKISILSMAGLIFSDSIYFQRSWSKLSRYSHWRKTGTSRDLRILSLLEASLTMGSHTKQNRSELRSAHFPPLAPQFAMGSKSPGSCCQSLPACTATNVQASLCSY